jgi:hypothetical protein
LIIKSSQKFTVMSDSWRNDSSSRASDSVKQLVANEKRGRKSQKRVILGKIFNHLESGEERTTETTVPRTKGTTRGRGQ